MKLRAVNYKFLGSILYYYRNDHKYSREKLVKIIYDDTHKSISAKTIQRIVEGTASKLDDVYADIAKVYGFDFIKDDHIYAQINELCIKSCNIINSGEKIKAYEDLLAKNKKCLNKYHNCLYLSHLLRLNIAALEYYLYGTIEDEELIYLLKETAFDLKHEAKDMAMYLLSCVSTKNILGLNYKDILTYGKFIKDKTIFLFEKVAYELEQWDTLLDLYKKHDELLKILPSLKSDVELIATLKYLSFIELNSKAYKEALAHIEAITKIKDWDKIIPRREYYNLIKRKGTISYFNEDYKTCFESLYEVAMNMPITLSFNVIFMCKSAEKLDKVDLIKDHLKGFEGIRESEEVLYKYFYDKYSDNKKGLEDYISLKIMPLIKKSGSTAYVDIFHDELVEFVSKSGNVEKLREYEKKTA